MIDCQTARRSVRQIKSRANYLGASLVSRVEALTYAPTLCLLDLTARLFARRQRADSGYCDFKVRCECYSAVTLQSL